MATIIPVLRRLLTRRTHGVPESAHYVRDTQDAWWFEQQRARWGGAAEGAGKSGRRGTHAPGSHRSRGHGLSS
jgi:hypothetical protein